MGGEDWGLVAALSIVTAAIAFTIAETAICSGIRERVKRWSTWGGKLVSCGYCMGHWVALALVAIYRPRLLVCWWPLDYFLTALIVAWAAAFQWVTLVWLFGRTGK